MSKRATLVVDLQNEYLPSGKLPLHGIDAAIANAARVVAAARQRGDLVVHVRHESDDPAAHAFVPGSEGVRIHPALAPQRDEPVIVKHSPSSFVKTGLHALLQERGVDVLTIVGAMSHMCIDATTRAAADLGYRATVVHDACATRDLEFRGLTVPAPQVHAALMAALAFAYAATPTTEEYLGAQ